ncbi:hypothetical protein J507_3156 [Acinetobacter sp. 1295259]|uniref:hypothetical protein n=1 Tax=Acinetobacter calcoaceticus/baumannii complex TaxID=909768 RepID=UPI00044D1991|nr:MULTISPECIES: hypothetical protein [Acinetobacter calcoaceticus/baumannii complex]EXA96555.1 hypothetical protein J507_3156 [Acinetobacter sp. 1295259]RSO72035.1 hypothetical protein EA754_17245 [Acinetobacter pittii]
MTNDFNAEQASQLAKGEDLSFDEMLESTLKYIKICASQKSNWAANSFEKTPKNLETLEMVVKDLEGRGFTVERTGDDVSGTKTIITIRF